MLQTSAVYTVAPTVTITKVPDTNTLTCTDGSVTLTAHGADSYLWNDGSATSSIVVNTGANYSVVGTINGCSANSVSTTLSTNASTLTIDSSTKTNPSGCNIHDGSISITGSTTNGTVEYSLNNIDRQANGSFSGL